MTVSINGKKLLIVGGRSGIARQLAEDAAAQGATVMLAGRRPVDAPGFKTAQVDLGDEDSIRALAADHANGPVTELDGSAVTRAFHAKVIGPILLAKHLAPRIREGGAILLF